MFSSNFRVYYEDTDAGGIVYYANYLKFAERARTEMLREVGIIQSELIEKEGIFFVVRRAEINLAKSARLDDLLTVETEIIKFGGASIEIFQSILCNAVSLADTKILIACVDKNSKPCRIPKNIISALT